MTVSFIEEPPSTLTVALHEKGWIWNFDWTWTEPRTGDRVTVFEAQQRMRCDNP